MKQICESCGKTIEKPAVAFRIKIEMYADPTPPEFTQEDLDRDIEEEIQALYDLMDQADPQEAEDEVHESYLFTLCGGCRGRIHRELRDRQILFDQHF